MAFSLTRDGHFGWKGNVGDSVSFTVQAGNAHSTSLVEMLYNGNAVPFVLAGANSWSGQIEIALGSHSLACEFATAVPDAVEIFEVAPTPAVPAGVLGSVSAGASIAPLQQKLAETPPEDDPLLAPQIRGIQA